MRVDIDMLPVYLSNMDMLPVDLAIDSSAKPERLRVGTEELTVHASSADTGGDLFAYEIRMPAGGGPPVMHRHAPSEVYYVLDGEFTFYIGRAAGVARLTATAGDVVPLPSGTPHTVRNEADRDAVAFAVHAPGAAMEGFSRAAAALAANDGAGMDGGGMDAVLTMAAEHGIELLGPIPSPDAEAPANPNRTG
jgi:mannose-6-phosphate isomerase-like protein (cupin superfamily)